jgi:hypothetical protein
MFVILAHKLEGIAESPSHGLLMVGPKGKSA